MCWWRRQWLTVVVGGGGQNIDEFIIENAPG
jgi:hypothetical protein